MTTLPDRPPPSTASYILATFIVAACAGYFLGQASSIGLFSSSYKSSSSSSSKSKSKSKSKHPPSSSSSTSNKSNANSKPSWPNSYDVTLHPDTSDEELMTRLKGGKKRRVKDSEDEESESESSESSESESGMEGEEQRAQELGLGEFNTFADNSEECKMVLVVRTDLGMGKGKIAAQCAHAALANYTALLSSSPSPSHTHPLLRRWAATGQAKIALQAPEAQPKSGGETQPKSKSGDDAQRESGDAQRESGEAQLELLRRKAVELGLCARIVRDAGRTQVASGSATVLGVGPGPRGVVDGVTGGLRLL
ncbi:hypothetical protein IMSHALPRED_005342 [Imshaugia aleurites]|uniref:peptidyl-tRNA hydrolase n=1 Tax=Imshaugia aleurites TaxID=172621 RepID=A0A8H3FCX1_9LECA|nr:hypothetical protein IMSHALPRED_005342 [Imshaugia aleurites]